MQGVQRLDRCAGLRMGFRPRRPAAAPGARSSAVGRVPGRPLRDPAIGSFDSRLPGWRVGARIKKMENAAVDVKPEPPPRCGKCGEDPKFIRAILDSAKGRNIRMYECQCGSITSAAASVGPRPRRKVAQVGKALFRVSLTAAYPPSAASWVRANLYGPVVPPPSRRRTPPPRR